MVKRNSYQDLVIKCVEDQKIFCSNVVLDEDEINNCNILAINILCCEYKKKKQIVSNIRGEKL